MATSEEELKSFLVDVGNRLLKPPTSVKELVTLLDRVEVYLSLVEQSPSKEIQNALSPTMKALVRDQLLKHADVDVKVSVASCISEITRITAPEVPYEDEHMKEVFQLIVSTFEGLPDMSSQSFIKRTCVLETVAKVRSCVVMLDLECDELILEMFKHFIKTIRDYHPENVYSCMENIMTRVIDESEEMSSDMLFCILDSIRKDNKEVSSIAQKLLKKVVETCADKLKPYIEIAMKTKGVSLADYDEVVSLICNEVTAETVIQSEHTGTSFVNVPAEERQAYIVNPTEPPIGVFTELEMSNGNAGVEADTLSGSRTLQDSKTSNADKASETVTAHPSSSVSNPDGPRVETVIKKSETIVENPNIKDSDLDVEKADEVQLTTELNVEKVVKKRGRKPKAKKTAPEPKQDIKSSKLVKQPDEVVESHNSCGDISPSPVETVNQAAGHSSPKLAEAPGGPSEEIIRESGDKLNGSPKNKTTASFGDIKEETNNPTVDTSELKAIVSEVGASVDRTDSGGDENMDKSTTLPSDDSQEVAAPTVDEPEETDVNSGKSHDDENMDKTTTLPSDGSQVVVTPAVDEPKEAKVNAGKLNVKSNVDENMDKTTTLPSDGSQEVAAPAVDELEEAKANAGKSHEQEDVPSGDSQKVEDSPKTEEGIKKRGRGKGKGTAQKITTQAAVEDNDKDATTNKSALKPVKNKEEIKETPKTSNKRKHLEINSTENKDYGEELVGAKVKVWWPADKRFYKGVIELFDSAKKKHKVLYADGEVEHLVLKKQRWAVIDPNEETYTDEETPQETPATEKHDKSKEAKDSASKKRLGRPPSKKFVSASCKPGNKPKDNATSNSKSKDESKAGAKAKTDNSKEEKKSKVESSKKLDKSSGRPIADDPSNAAGKSKSIDKSIEEDSKSSDTKVKGTKPGDETPVIISAGKPKNKMTSKTKSGSVVKEDIKAVSDAKTGGKFPKIPPTKASGEIDLDDHPSGSEGDDATDEQTPRPAKASGSSKRKAPLEKGNKDGAKPEPKGKKMRKT